MIKKYVFDNFRAFFIVSSMQRHAQACVLWSKHTKYISTLAGDGLTCSPLYETLSGSIFGKALNRIEPVSIQIES